MSVFGLRKSPNMGVRRIFHKGWDKVLTSSTELMIAQKQKQNC